MEDRGENEVSKSRQSLMARIIAGLRRLGHPCTGGELCFHDVLVRGEHAADLHKTLELLQAAGMIRRVAASQPLQGRRPDTAWELDIEMADWRPIRQRNTPQPRRD